MRLGMCLRAVVCAFGILCFGAGVRVEAATISATYSYSISITGNPEKPPLIGTGTGTLLPLGSMTWSDRTFPDLTTGAFTGTFTMTFANGTLFGGFKGQTDLTTPPTATLLTQVLNISGGTGALAGYNGTLTGTGILNLVTLQESDAGAGTLNTTPEPASVILLPVGLLWLAACRNRAVRARCMGRL
jgi:hypothetical protein